MSIGRTFRLLVVLVVLTTASGLQPASAANTSSASITLSGTVASLILPDVVSSSPSCRLIRVGHGAAWCVLTTPLTVRVRSNEQWSGYLAGRTQVGNSWSHSALHCGSFGFRTWLDVAFALPLAWPGDTWIRNGAAGTSTHSWYLAVFVTDVSRINQVTTTLRFTVAQRTSGLAYTLTIPLTWQPV